MVYGVAHLRQLHRPSRGLRRMAPLLLFLLLLLQLLHLLLEVLLLLLLGRLPGAETVVRWGSEGRRAFSEGRRMSKGKNKDTETQAKLVYTTDRHKQINNQIAEAKAYM